VSARDFFIKKKKIIEVHFKLNIHCRIFWVTLYFKCADVNAKDQEWLTPLHRAAASQNEGSVALLLRKGADVNAQDRFCQTALHVAAANKAMKCVHILIPYVSSLNAADRFGRSALHHAVHSGHAEVVKLLVAYSADVSCRDKQGFTPLHAAALGGHTEVVKYLLKHGAEVRDHREVYGCHKIILIRLNLTDALHMVCYAGQRAVASELVNCGASVNQSNVRGCTPLHLSAASADGALCLELLVNNGANNKAGKSPLHVAAIHGHFTRSQILLQNGAEVECVDKYGYTPLHSAAKHGHELLITTLLNNGADVARRGINGMTPLHLAVFYGFSDCCQKLLSSDICHPSKNVCLSNKHLLLAGFDINTVDSQGRTCLHVAASGGNVECLKLLLNSGAALNKKDNFGRSPLHYTSVNGSYLCTVALVKAGADVNELDVNGCSPLHYAAAAQTSHRYNTYNNNCPDSETDEEPLCVTCSYRCLEFLLNSGADPTLRDSKGFSPVHYAAACGDRHNLKLLIEMSFKCVEDVESCVPVSPFHLAAYNGHSEALQVLSETLVNVDIQDPRGHTALYMAALRGHGPCVELLLLQGASYAIREHIHRWTPLHASAANGQTDCLLMMLQRDEKDDIFDLMDIHGQTPLMLATLGSHADCVHMLLERGSNPDTGDRRSRTALHRAAVVGSEECVSALLVHGAFSLCRDVYGRSPLHLAASCGHAWLLRPLLDAASLSDPLDSLLDYSAYTPTHWAAYHGHNDCLEALLEYRPSSFQEGNTFTPLHCALIAGHDGAARLLVETMGTEIMNLIDGKGRTPLHASAYAGNVAALQLALTCGSDVNSVDYSGRSALMLAAENGHTSAVDFLLHQAGADLSLLDINSNSALHIACRRSHEMCALLILAEIDDPTLINSTNTALQTPLHIAARNGLATVVEVLLTRGATVLAIDQDGHIPALACAPNKDVADCLALIISTMMPFSAGTSCGISLTKHCGIAASHQPLSKTVPIQLITEEP
uniref:Ankyrin repeat domain 52 n=1 Tax=Cyprinus carpio TaxID=7962 RepID=A0A8C1MKE6_CYPCA